MIELKMMLKTFHIVETPIAEGQKLNFTAVDSQSKSLTTVDLNSVKSKWILISSVPSIDTKTCGLQTEQFNEYAHQKLKNFTIITISKDLPFAQKRACDALKLAKNFQIWSDYRHNENNFAQQSHLIIDELQLLARSVLILNDKHEVVYRQIVTQIASEPDYQAVLEFITKNCQ